MSSKPSPSAIDPLRDFLGDVLSRLETLESRLGIQACGSSATGPGGQPLAVATSGSFGGVGHFSTIHPKSPVPTKPTLQVTSGGEAPAVKAYDAYVRSAVIPFCSACDDLQGLQDMGKLIKEAWEGVGAIIVLASRAKAPDTTGTSLAELLAPYLTKTQTAVTKIRELKLDRKLDMDRHQKAVVELLASLSWILVKPPNQPLPATVVKEALSSAEFWSNRIRKDFKGKDNLQIAFCDTLKKCLTELVQYIEEYHKAGLAWNAKGVSLAEAAIRLTDEAERSAASDGVFSGIGGPPLDGTAGKSPIPKARHPTLKGAVVGGGNVGGLMSELANRKNADGSSAATGLRKVTKDQQTWRKEYKGAAPPATLQPAPTLESASTHSTSNGTAAAAVVVVKKKEKKTPLRGLPIFEYQDRGFKWVIENHTKETAQKEHSATDGIITIDITDPKQQVYLYNCGDICVKINGKFKSLVLDSCQKCSIVYDTLISSAEMVNCKRIQLQVNGVCPVFTIDKTQGVLIWLSKESTEVSNFTTSQSSEMNVSFPSKDGDQKELPIPEQFVHKINAESLTSDVSDLYH